MSASLLSVVIGGGSDGAIVSVVVSGLVDIAPESGSDGVFPFSSLCQLLE